MHAHLNIALFAGTLLLSTGGGCSRTAEMRSEDQPEEQRTPLTVASKGERARPPYRFAPDDERFLDEVQHGAFNYLWRAASPTTGMVHDRTSKTVVSIGGVGFQLSALPVGVERGWVSRADAEARATLILSTLLKNPGNRKAGLFYHYLDDQSAGISSDGYERAVSTIDSALFFAGAITASSYFGGEVRAMADRLLAEADWRFFVGGGGTPIKRGPPKDYENGFVSLAWEPVSQAEPSGDGFLSPYYWVDAGDEHRLVTFLAVCAPDSAKRVDPRLYYQLRRQVGQWRDSGPF